MLINIDQRDDSDLDLMEAIDFYIERKADEGQVERLRKIYNSIKEQRRQK